MGDVVVRTNIDNGILQHPCDNSRGSGCASVALFLIPFLHEANRFPLHDFRRVGFIMFRKRVVSKESTTYTDTFTSTAEKPDEILSTPAAESSIAGSSEVVAEPALAKRKRDDDHVLENWDEPLQNNSQGQSVSQSASAGAPASPTGNVGTSKPLVCRPFQKHGSCKWGAECKYAHVYAEEATSVTSIGKDAWHKFRTKSTT